MLLELVAKPAREPRQRQGLKVTPLQDLDEFCSYTV